MMNAKIENGKLIIELPINDPPQHSRTGKTLVIASTHGNKKVKIDTENIYIGVNAYSYPDNR